MSSLGAESYVGTFVEHLPSPFALAPRSLKVKPLRGEHVLAALLMENA
jgi:hypothetical protein